MSLNKHLLPPPTYDAQNSPKVSVVVPIYGVEKYLNQCVDSILAQTLKDIEIILVDDGSKDKCPQIVDEYAGKDRRVVAIHQPNGGYGKAVNHGIDVAKGEYIGIVEPDDFIEPMMYETLYKDAKKYNNVDIVKGIYKEYFDTKDGCRTLLPTPLLEINPPKNPFNIYEYSLPLEHHASIWTAIYRKDFLLRNGIRVLEKNKGRYADQNWRYETLMLAKQIYWEKQPFYNYRLTNENASSYKKNNPNDIFDVYKELNLFCLQHKLEYEKIKEHLYIEIYRHMFWNLSRVDERYYNICTWKIHKVFRAMDKKVVLSSTRFNEEEKKKFIIYFSTSYLFIKYINIFLKNIFSLTNSKNKKHKQLTLFGIKFKIKRKIDKKIRNLERQIDNLSYRLDELEQIIKAAQPPH